MEQLLGLSVYVCCLVFPMHILYISMMVPIKAASASELVTPPQKRRLVSSAKGTSPCGSTEEHSFCATMGRLYTWSYDTWCGVTPYHAIIFCPWQLGGQICFLLAGKTLPSMSLQLISIFTCYSWKYMCACAYGGVFLVQFLGTFPQLLTRERQPTSPCTCLRRPPDHPSASQPWDLMITALWTRKQSSHHHALPQSQHLVSSLTQQNSQFHAWSTWQQHPLRLAHLNQSL